MPGGLLADEVSQALGISATSSGTSGLEVCKCDRAGLQRLNGAKRNGATMSMSGPGTAKVAAKAELKLSL